MERPFSVFDYRKAGSHLSYGFLVIGWTLNAQFHVQLDRIFPTYLT